MEILYYNYNKSKRAKIMEVNAFEEHKD